MRRRPPNRTRTWRRRRRRRGFSWTGDRLTFARSALTTVGLAALIVLAPGAALHVDAGPLHEAISAGDGDEARRLVDAGADLDAATARGLTPILAAIFAGESEIAEMLLEAGADPNARTELDTALLVELGASVDDGDSIEATPLLAAAFANDRDVVELLLTAGVDANAAANDGLTALHLTAVQGHDGMATLLLARGAEVDARGADGETPLLAALREGKEPVVQILLAHGASPDQSRGDGFTALLAAIDSGHDAAAEALVKAGADVNATSRGGVTPLLLAVDNGEPGLAEILIDAGADVDARDDTGRTALAVALRHEHRSLADLLVARGADVGGVEHEQRRTPPIDTTGFDPDLAHLRAEPGLAGVVAARLDPRGLAVDATGGKIYWTEFAGHRIRRADLDGSNVETVVADGIHGPVGVAVAGSANRLFWTSDGVYPRTIESASLDGDDVATIMAGQFVNRPHALVVDEDAAQLYWTEAIAGRIRRTGLDGSGLTEVLSSGISSVADRPGSQAMVPMGLAFGADADRLYWTDMPAAGVWSAGTDGSRPRQIAGATQDVDFPVGIAIDADSRTLYWADRAGARIVRSALDGSGITEIVSAADGLVAPTAVALDRAGGRLYWTDTATGAIASAKVDGGDVRTVIDLTGTATAHAAGDRNDPAGRCLSTAARAGRRLLERSVAALTTCLRKVDALKAVKRGTNDARRAAATCAGQLRRLRDHRPQGRGLDAEMRAALRRPCRGFDATAVAARSRKSSHAHAAATALDAVAARCTPEAGTKRRAWIACMARGHRRLARATVATEQLRAREWLEEVRPFIAALPAPPDDPTRVPDALAALDAEHEALAALRSTASRRGAPARVSASGQITSYRARRAGRDGPVGVADDGRMRAGAALRFVDNGDGTITDLTTRLMWEKKCDCDGNPHDYRRGYVWTGPERVDTIFDWLADVNSEGEDGFAGHSDWRIPTVKELQSIVDYERFNPAVTTAFDGAACGLGCTDLGVPGCSCTNMSAYWSSTTYANTPGRAMVLTFNLGLIGDDAKIVHAGVRAVRDAAPAEEPAD